MKLAVLAQEQLTLKKLVPSEPETSWAGLPLYIWDPWSICCWWKGRSILPFAFPPRTKFSCAHARIL
jgi:hypothetical protein